MTEREWQLRVVGLARILGWRHAHFRPLQTSKGWRTPQSGDAGFPDLVMVRPPRCVFVELKVGTAVRPEQRDWLADLTLIPGVEVYVWRPPDWEQVQKLLIAKERP